MEDELVAAKLKFEGALDRTIDDLRARFAVECGLTPEQCDCAIAGACLSLGINLALSGMGFPPRQGLRVRREVMNSLRRELCE